ncbi:sugar ABC transporter ATP-binding protein [Streptomyces mirabilis]|uniref:sugar ABC transporter ATP-binding protein n=1 Tax=Streptomyces mirabilis TaxID=68239 RepID=UPI0036821101
MSRSDTDRPRDGMLRLRGLAKTYSGVRVLGPVDLDLAPGEIHCLLGGNGSGKSTLIKCLAGIVRADPGGTVRSGESELAVADLDPARARALGMHFVHQQYGVFLPLSVADNIAAADRYPIRFPGRIDRARLEQSARKALERLSLTIDPAQPMSQLSPAARTLVAIARALKGADDPHGSLLVLDEPTASLPAAEVAELLTVLRSLADAGQKILYVTHHLDEVLAVADRCTVLRDGKVSARLHREQLDKQTLVDAIAGRAVASGRPRDRADRDQDGHDPQPPVLTVRNLRAGRLGPVGFDLDRGEIVGVAGLLGSGRSTLLRCLFGALHRSSGTTTYQGRSVSFGSPAEAMRAGVAFVPEDRAAESAFLDLSLADNLVAAGRRRRWWISPASVRQAGRNAIADYSVRSHGPDQLMSRLSGGNQQKVVLARWLTTRPALLMLDEPTQGVDVGARAELHGLIRQYAAAGGSVLVASSADEELASLCDRVLVLRDGHIAASLSGTGLTTETITRAALGHELEHQGGNP